MSAEEEVIPPILASEIKILLTGGPDNEDPNLSLGGQPSQKELTGNLNNLFDRINTTEATNGLVDYRCVAIRNTNPKKTALRVKLFIESNTSNAKTGLKIGIGSSGINGDEVIIDSDTTKPANVNFVALETLPTIANIGDLAPNQRINVWFEWDTKPGVLTDADDKTTLRLDFDQAAEPVNPPPPHCPIGFHFDTTLNICVPDDPGDPPDPECPAGFRWNPVKQICELETLPPPECPAGTVWNPVTEQCEPTQPPPPPPVNMKFAAVGDTNCTDAAEENFGLIKSNNVDFFLALGDFSYGSSQKCWLDLAKGLGSPLYPSNIYPMIGNHDDEEDGTRQHRIDIINAFPIMTQNGWYAITKGNIRIIIMDTQKDYEEGSAQYNFVLTQLQAAANDPNILWRIVCYHKPSIATADGDHDGLADLRDDYHPLFDQYKVDFVYAGHRHSYTRTKPLNYKTTSPFYTIVNDSATGPYDKVNGTQFITNGAGGRNHRPNNADEPFVAHANDTDFGTVIAEVSNNGKTITQKFISIDGSVVDQWVTTK